MPLGVSKGADRTVISLDPEIPEILSQDFLSPVNDCLNFPEVPQTKRSTNLDRLIKILQAGRDDLDPRRDGSIFKNKI